MATRRQSVAKANEIRGEEATPKAPQSPRQSFASARANKSFLVNRQAKEALDVVVAFALVNEEEAQIETQATAAAALERGKARILEQKKEIHHQQCLLQGQQEQEQKLLQQKQKQQKIIQEQFQHIQQQEHQPERKNSKFQVATLKIIERKRSEGFAGAVNQVLIQRLNKSFLVNPVAEKDARTVGAIAESIVQQTLEEQEMEREKEKEREREKAEAEAEETAAEEEEKRGRLSMLRKNKNNKNTVVDDEDSELMQSVNEVAARISGRSASVMMAADYLLDHAIKEEERIRAEEKAKMDAIEKAGKDRIAEINQRAEEEKKRHEVAAKEAEIKAKKLLEVQKQQEKEAELEIAKKLEAANQLQKDMELARIAARVAPQETGLNLIIAAYHGDMKKVRHLADIWANHPVLNTKDSVSSRTLSSFLYALCILYMCNYYLI